MTRLIYGYDPLCGWCYGFVPVLRQLRESMPDLAVHPVMGGLVTGARIGPYARMGDYIRQASTHMTKMTGMALSAAFFERILGNPGVVASSLMPCTAVLQVRSLAPDRAAEFASAVQVAHFADGEDLNEPQVYDRIARSLGLQVKFDLPDAMTVSPALAAEFASARTFGINSYPTLILEKGGHSTLLPTEYDPGAVVALVSDAMDQDVGAGGYIGS